MLTQEENEFLTRVGPGTPCGELMRRYWHPVFPEAKLAENPVQKIRILGEDLVLYRDRTGRLGLLGERCPHRLVDLKYGIPEEEGLRCPYHGWLFDQEGRCLEQPLEPPDSTFKEKVRAKAYRVEAMGGLIWAYMGPDPAPLLPRWDLFVREDGFRQITGHWLPCNWLQVMENRGDLGHTTYLHGRLFQYVLERQGRLTDDPQARYNFTMAQQADRLQRGVYTRYRPIYHEFGFTKGSLESDQSEENSSWTVGANPILFPYTLASGPGGLIRRYYQIGVPVDDTTTWHIMYSCFVFPPEVGAPVQESVPYVDVPLTDENGEAILDFVLGQDMVAWWAQGAITDRTQEHLALSDTLVIAYRQLLKQQIDVVLDGGEPIGLVRDPVRNRHLYHPFPPGVDDTSAPKDGSFKGWGFYRTNYHKVSKGGWRYIDDDVERYSPDRELLIELYARAERAWEERMSAAQTSSGESARSG